MSNLGPIPANAGTPADVAIVAPLGTGTPAAQAVSVDIIGTVPTTVGNIISAFVFPGTSGGTNKVHLISAAGTNATLTKASAGSVWSAHITNLALYPVYLKFFNKATAPIPGTDTPVLTFGCQNGVAAAIVEGQRDIAFPVGMNFGLGIGFAITKGIADLDATAVAAGDCSVEFGWV